MTYNLFFYSTAADLSRSYQEPGLDAIEKLSFGTLAEALVAFESYRDDPDGSHVYTASGGLAMALYGPSGGLVADYSNI